MTFADRDGPGWRQRQRRRDGDLAFLEDVRAARARGDLARLRVLAGNLGRKNDPAWKRVAVARSIGIVLAMKFDRRLRLLEAIARAASAVGEAMAIALEVDEDEGAARSIPPAAPSEASDTRFQSLPPAVKDAPDPRVDTLSTSHANPGSIMPRRTLPEKPTLAGFHAFSSARALEELRRGHAEADTVEKQLRISNVARVLIAQGLIDEAEVEEIVRPSQRPRG